MLLYKKIIFITIVFFILISTVQISCYNATKASRTRYAYRYIYYPIPGIKPDFNLANIENPTPITGYSQGRERQPVVSPDGKYVAFVNQPQSKIPGVPFTSNIKVFEVENPNRWYDVTETEAAQSVSGPSWIRNNRILYTMFDPATELFYNIYFIDFPRIRPDGYAVLGREHRIWQVGMDIRSSAVSPDGKKCIICADVAMYKKGKIDIFRRQPHLENPMLFEFDMDERTIKNIGSGFDPSFSPDGKKIVYGKLVGDNSFIYVKDLQTGFDGPITHGDDAWDWMPCWSPGSDEIAFASLRGGDWNIYKIDEDGNNMIQLTISKGTEWDPCWAPGGYIYFSFYTGIDWDIWRVQLKKPKY
jgi:Tol biopolymer transport system component